MNRDDLYEKFREVMGHEGVMALFVLCTLICIYAIVEG